MLPAYTSRNIEVKIICELFSDSVYREAIFFFWLFVFCQSKIIQMVMKFPASNNQVATKFVTEGNSESAQFSSQHHDIFLYSLLQCNHSTDHNFVPQIFSSFHVGLF
jgi:hypothetical protein